MKKLRLLLFEDCLRDCPGCCNKDFDLKALPVETKFKQYDEIILTGGEPMLKPEVIRQVVHKIRIQNNTARIYLYTADVRKHVDVISLLHLYLSGITVTLHDAQDAMRFLEFYCNLDRYIFKDIIYKKSLRLNVFKDVPIWAGYNKAWKIKRDIEWIKNCPLPENEVFKRFIK